MKMWSQAGVIVTLMVVMVTGLNPDPIVDIVYEKGVTETAPVSSKLIVNKTEKAEMGSPFMMSCSVPDQDNIDIELCTWRRNGLSEMFVQESGLYGYMRSKVQGITVLSSDKK